MEQAGADSFDEAKSLVKLQQLCQEWEMDYICLTFEEADEDGTSVTETLHSSPRLLPFELPLDFLAFFDFIGLEVADPGWERRLPPRRAAIWSSSLSTSG